MLVSIVRDSFWGNFIYLGSGKKALKYREEVFAEAEREKVNFETIPYTQHLSQSFTNVHTWQSAVSLPLNSPASIKSHIYSDDDQIIVTWENEKDPDNPCNWPTWYKIIFILQITMMSAFIYMAAAIYTPSVEQLMKDMETTRLMANMPLTFFTLGYGVGPMVFGPLSENPRFGRTTIYIISLFIFFVMQFPCALSTDIASLTVLRFFAGFFASPSLATGGASIGDVVLPPYMPIALAVWAAGTFSVPSLGPLIGAALISVGGYHWPYWFICIVSGMLFFFYGIFLPESYGKTILYRKASRLRSITGNKNITSEGHIANESHSFKYIIVEAAWRPFEIIVFEPVLLLMNVYSGFIYAVMYMWFEAFPIVFEEMNGFNIVGEGASSLCLTTGLVISVCFHLPIVYSQTTKRFDKGEQVNPEVYLPMCIFGSCFLPIGLVIFAWTATPSLHWVLPMLGAATFMFGSFIVYQTLFNYIGMSFPAYLASVYAGNGLFRSLMAAASPLYGRAMFTNLGTKNFPVAWGTTLLASITSVLVLVPVFFYLRGPKLRARSKFSK